MPVTKKTPVVKAFFAFDIGQGQSIFYRAWRLMNMDGPLCKLPDPHASEMAFAIEQMRKQQVHVDELKRLCHVPV